MARKRNQAPGEAGTAAQDAAPTQGAAPHAEAPAQTAQVNGGNGGGSRRPPAHEVRLGRIKATVWANESQAHGTWYSINLTRSYYDEKAKQWKSATSLGRDDLLVAAEALRQAFVWVASQGQQSSTQNKEGATAEAPIPF